MVSYKSGLSSKGFRNLARKVREYRSELTDKCEEFAFRMAEEGISIAKIKISSFNAVFSGELLNSMQLQAGDVFKNGAEYIIYTGCEWASYVEFGTGIVGEKNPHPETSLVGWRYDVNSHGEKGWFYFSNGEWHWTKGMPSRPFMYETGAELALKASDIAREVFSDD